MMFLSWQNYYLKCFFLLESAIPCEIPLAQTIAKKSLMELKIYRKYISLPSIFLSVSENIS
jgi:hypothetical protein